MKNLDSHNDIVKKFHIIFTKCCKIGVLCSTHKLKLISSPCSIRLSGQFDLHPHASATSSIRGWGRLEGVASLQTGGLRRSTQVSVPQQEDGLRDLPP